ncbi:hypothetical protein SDC9_107923 [bioreactor metagenome]|uniref:N-acetyltransferase domain-containing protein n=1 Tax=bioreactor metagenome TaxID=1076179 RepID=A0A645B6I4_9ZZZZ|nr:GNAT family N-acetyltransferase [Candidatus Metalachnospira sp.]
MRAVDNIELRFAETEDLDEVSALFYAATEEMNLNNIPQWDEVYPDRRTFAEDIERHEMQLIIIDGQIAAVFVLSKEYDVLYQTGKWKYPDSQFKILHRICVHPHFQNRGLAKTTMNIIFDILRKEGIETLRFDGFTLNPYAIRLYKSLECNIVGTVDFRKGKFFLYEKYLC